jgi:hypothetical protein
VNFDVAAVHLEQVTSKQTGFVTARTGSNFEDTATPGQCVAGEDNLFEFLAEFLELNLQIREFLTGHFFRVRIGLLADHLLCGIDILNDTIKRADLIGDLREATVLALNGQQLVGVRENVGILKLSLQLFEALQFVLQTRKHDAKS